MNTQQPNLYIYKIYYNVHYVNRGVNRTAIINNISDFRFFSIRNDKLNLVHIKKLIIQYIKEIYNTILYIDSINITSIIRFYEKKKIESNVIQT